MDTCIIQKLQFMKYSIAGFMFFCICCNVQLRSQDLDPWAYANLPLKLNSLSVSYAFMKGNVISDPGAPLQDFNITTHKIVVSYVRTFNVFGRLGRAQITIPGSYLSGNAVFKGNDTSGSRTGLDDIKLRFGVNLFGSPPLEPQQFGKYRQEAILGLSLVVTMPTGQYYSEKLVNLGTNRWGFKPELGVSLRIGQFFLETYGGVKFTTKNSDYLGSKHLRNLLFIVCRHTFVIHLKIISKLL